VGPVEIIAAFLTLWGKMRETIDPAIRERWDKIALNDYMWLRSHLGIPANDQLVPPKET
jgi:hypothetical protein